MELLKRDKEVDFLKIFHFAALLSWRERGRDAMVSVLQAALG
jgi:hypothetical protein